MNAKGHTCGRQLVAFQHFLYMNNSYVMITLSLQMGTSSMVFIAVQHINNDSNLKVILD